MYNSKSPYKIAIVGDAGVGKSSIVERIVRDRFLNNLNSTVGAAFSTYQHENIQYQIWDTAGQERYQALLPMYLRSAKILLIVYDVTSSKSVTQMIGHWYDFVYNNSDVIRNCIESGGNEYYRNNNEYYRANNPYTILVIGNKYDLSDNSKNYNIERALELIKDYNNNSVSHVLVSAKTGINIEDIFKHISKFVALNNTDDDHHDDKVIKITKDYWDSLFTKETREEHGAYGIINKCCTIN